MHHIAFLQDLALVMIVAAIVTVLFRRFKQPVVPGYILAGVIIVNPAPDEEIREEDRVLLIGTQTQLAAAQTALAGNGAV